jgi:hypothetical protein
LASGAAIASVFPSGVGFHRVVGEAAVQQELSLGLTVGNLPLTHFDSGLVLAKSVFPLIGVTISIHAGRCADTIIVVKAAPVLARYQVISHTMEP